MDIISRSDKDGLAKQSRYSPGVFIAPLVDAGSGIQVVVAERW